MLLSSDARIPLLHILESVIFLKTHQICLMDFPCFLFSPRNMFYIGFLFSHHKNMSMFVTYYLCLISETHELSDFQLNKQKIMGIKYSGQISTIFSQQKNNIKCKNYVCAIFHARVLCHIAEKCVGWNCFLRSYQLQL